MTPWTPITVPEFVALFGGLVLIGEALCCLHRRWRP